MSHTFHERVFDTVFTLEHDIYFGIVQIQSPRAPPFQWFKNVMVWIVEVLIALFSKKWSKYAPFPDKPTWKFQRFQCTDRGRRRLIRHGSHENSFILKPLQSVIGTGIYHQDHRNWGETSKKLTEHYHRSQHVSTIQKIYCFSARENWETVETPVDSDIMDLYGLFLLRSPSLFGAMSDLPVENPTAKDRYLCKILDLGQNSTNKKCIVDVFF